MTFDRDLIAEFISSLTLIYTLMIIAYSLQSFVPIGYSAPVMAIRRFLDDTVAVHATGRPILVGVEYTHTAEWLGRELEKRGLPVEILGAKSDKEEAEIIARAGRPGGCGGRLRGGANAAATRCQAHFDSAGGHGA
jgi:hypothetical protein